MFLQTQLLYRILIYKGFFSQNVLKHKDIVLFNLDDYSHHHDMYKFWKRNDEDMQGLWHLTNLDKFKNRRNLSNIA